MFVDAYHKNIKLLLTEMHRKYPEHFTPYGEEFIKVCICDPTSKSCMSSNCQLCKDKFWMKFVEELYTQGFHNDSAKWHQWEKSDDGRTEKVQKQGTMKDLLNFLEDQIKPFLFHYFINKEQAKAYNKCCQDATETNFNKAMIQTDFLRTLLAVIKMKLLALIGNEQCYSLYCQGLV